MGRDRAVPRAITVSTATGIFGPVYFGGGYRVATLAYAGGATAQTMVGTLQGAVGGSTVFYTVLALTTANSTGANVNLVSTGTRTFSKLRLNLSANNRTAATTVWLGVTD